MMFEFLKSGEKKVEYIELIYDLVFVYVIGRNNSLVVHVSNGFIDAEHYLTYVLCTLITIQIWYLTTLFINRYGDNGVSEYIGLFINMFLLYYMADGTRLDWHQAYFYRYNIAWALVLLNILVQYYLKYRKTSTNTPWESSNIRFFMQMLSGMIVFSKTGFPASVFAMPAGIIASMLGRKKLDLVAVDFPHLTERVMLYVVFTFGEMIIAISGYFSGEFNLHNFYYAICAFLIVVGLFMSYGFLYDHLIDREMSISGNAYMILHIFIIFALSSLTNALEFMHEPEVALVPKTMYLIASFVVYYLFMFTLIPFTKGYDGTMKQCCEFLIALIVFVVLLAVTYRSSFLGIGISVIMTFTICQLEFRYWKAKVLPLLKEEQDS